MHIHYRFDLNSSVFLSMDYLIENVINEGTKWDLILLNMMRL